MLVINFLKSIEKDGLTTQNMDICRDIIRMIDDGKIVIVEGSKSSNKEELHFRRKYSAIPKRNEPLPHELSNFVDENKVDNPDGDISPDGGKKPIADFNFTYKEAAKAAIKLLFTTGMSKGALMESQGINKNYSAKRKDFDPCFNTTVYELEQYFKNHMPGYWLMKNGNKTFAVDIKTMK